MTNAEEIASIKEILSTGVSASAVDGTSTSIDRDSLRRRLRELQAIQESGRVKPAIQSVFLGGWGS